MDIAALTHVVTTALIPVLPYLLKAGEKGAEEAGKNSGGEAWEWSKELWNKLRPKVEAKPAALEAAQDVTKTPKDEDAQAALRNQLKKLLSEDESLAREIGEWWEKAKAAGVTVPASGERSVAIGGDVKGSTIVTGDWNTVKPKSLTHLEVSRAVRTPSHAKRRARGVWMFPAGRCRQSPSLARRNPKAEKVKM
jgi:hypothetical protein